MSTHELSTFDDWQRWIEREYLVSGGPVVLFADDESFERRLGGKGTAAAVSLATAVRSTIDLRAARPFDQLKPAVNAWRRSGRSSPPPVLPVLLLSSYAAGRMQSSEGFSAQNFYSRFAESITLGTDPGRAGEARAALQRGFSEVRDWWRLLHEWLEDQKGTRGTSTIRHDDRLTLIGYPLSQAILREADKVVLTQFFERTFGRTVEIPDLDWLVLRLRLWSARRTDLSLGFRHALGGLTTRDESGVVLARMLGELVALLARSWDGVVRTSDGRQRLRLRIALDLEDGWERSWRVFGPTGPQRLVATVEGEAVQLEKDEESGYYSGPVLPLGSDSLLKTGWRVAAGSATLTHSGADVLVFRTDRYLGAWSSVESLIPFEPHVIAVAHSRADAVKDALNAAELEFSPTPARSADVLLPGYVIFRGVTVVDVSTWAQVTRAAGLSEIEELAVEVAGRPRLVNGLRAPTVLGPRVYIEGGEPDLVIPMGLEPRAVDVELDGRRQTMPPSNESRELSRFAIGVGSHSLAVESTRLDFEVLSAAEVELALRADNSGTDIAFASWPTADDPAVGVAELEVRRGRDRYCWLLEDGSVRELREPDAPDLLTSLGVRGGGVFAPLAPRGARWLATKRRGRWRCEDAGGGGRSFESDYDIPALWGQRGRNAMSAAIWKQYGGERL